MYLEAWPVGVEVKDGRGMGLESELSKGIGKLSINGLLVHKWDVGQGYGSVSYVRHDLSVTDCWEGMDLLEGHILI